jgi:hypothetical protein
MTCNCIGGNPCPCRRGQFPWMVNLQWPWYIEQPVRQGWICPRCNVCVSPDAQQCPSCMPPATSLAGSTSSPPCDHQWATDTGGTRCLKCGLPSSLCERS